MYLGCRRVPYIPSSPIKSSLPSATDKMIPGAMKAYTKGWKEVSMEKTKFLLCTEDQYKDNTYGMVWCIPTYMQLSPCLVILLVRVRCKCFQCTGLPCIRFSIFGHCNPHFSAIGYSKTTSCKSWQPNCHGVDPICRQISVRKVA